MNDVERWLTGLGLGKYAVTFADNEVDLETLLTLSERDLEKLGIPLGPRKKLLKAIADLSTGTTSGAVMPATATLPRTAREAERRQLTVMFCDLADSTALSVRFDPEDLREMIRRYQDCCTHIIKRFDGYISRFMGDGVLIFFGYPQAGERDTERAVRAALEIVDSVSRLKLDSNIRLQTRISIATGKVVVGDLIGEGASEEQAAIGETPNLAARLQSLAEPDSVVIAEPTRTLLGELFELADLGSHSLKGFAEPIRAWRVLGERAVESRFEATRGVTGLSRLIGRDEQVELMKRRWQRAQAGEGQVIALVGEPGIGKSRLAQTLREQLADAPHAVLHYDCSPHDQNSALSPFINQLARTARFARNDPPSVKLDKLEALLAQSVRNASKVAPLFAALLSVPTEGRYEPLDLTPRRQKDETLEALQAQLAGLAEQHPILVVFEDLHWSDPTTLEFLERIVDSVRNLPVLLLMTYRPTFSAPWSSLPHVTVLTLNRLRAPEITALVAELTKGKRLPDTVLDQIVRHTDGVPLFVEELTQTVLEAGFLQNRGDHYALDGPLPPLAVPTTLQDSLMARLDRSGGVKEVAQIGAVIGRQFAYAVLAAVSHLQEAALQAALQQLAAAELVTCRGTPPDASYTFRHALLQEAAYQSLLRSTRQDIHLRIAKALEQNVDLRFQATPELLAHHYFKGGAPHKAIAYWQRATEHALAHSAPVEAMNHVRNSLESLKRLPDTPERLRLELELATELGAALRAIRGYASAEVEDIYLKARELCGRIGATSERFKVEWALMQLFLVRGDLGRAHELSQSLLGHAKQDNERPLLLDAHLANGMTLFHLGNFSAACNHLEQAVALYRPDVDRPRLFTHGQDPGVFSLSYLAWTRWFLGFPDQAKTEVEQTVATAARQSHTFSHVSALTFAARIYQCRREYVKVKQVASEMIQLSQDRGFAYYEAQGVIQHGWALVLTEGEENGIEQMQEGLAALQKTGTVLGLRGFLVQLAEGYIRLGWAERAVSALEKAESQDERRGTHCWDAEILRLRGEVLAGGPGAEQQEAEVSLRSAVDIARRQGARLLALRAAVSYARMLSDQGRYKTARKLLSDSLKDLSEGRETVDLREARTLLRAVSQGEENNHACHAPSDSS